MNDRKIIEMAALANGKNLGNRDIKLAWKDVFPDGGEFCPFQPAHMIPEKAPDKVLIVRIYHPCLTECALYNKGKKGCSLATG